MNPVVLVRLRNQLTVILGGIETGNLELAKQGVVRMNDELKALSKLPPLLNGAVSATVQ